MLVSVSCSGEGLHLLGWMQRWKGRAWEVEVVEGAVNDAARRQAADGSAYVVVGLIEPAAANGDGMK